eukprot:1031555-Prorocentrum_minimum.AAC.1
MLSPRRRHVGATSAPHRRHVGAGPGRHVGATSAPRWRGIGPGAHLDAAREVALPGGGQLVPERALYRG